ncbi:MAG: DUF1858 domain-containing protein [Candidatus Pacebacteria bacterium]|nr:DUF1858 domain-containing protein [Candidatus Paceibacterota bacterium]
MSKITKNTTLSELLENPKAVEVLAKYHLPCLGCPFAETEMETLKIGEICKMYGLNLEKLLKDLQTVDKK